MADKEVSELRFGLSFDGSKLKASIEETCKKVQESFKKSFESGAEAATKAVETGNAEIDAILQDTERSAKSKAASISAIYQKMGMSQSEALKKAWSHIERDSSSGTQKVNKHTSSILEKMRNAFSGIKKGSKSTKDSIGKDIDSTSASADKMSSKFSAVAKKIMVTLAGAFAVSSLISFGKSCIDLGSDLAEVQNVVDVTFGDMSDKVNEYAKAAMKNVGLSETMAKQFTGNYGAMAKAFGFTTEQAYEMSTSLTTLAGDVASFYNLDQETAYTKLKSVFTGETASLKELGVVMSQTALDSYALANGYGKTTSAMTEAEKVSLRFAFVTDTLSASSGDFIRTAGGWANQMRVLNLQFDSFKATIGQGLINALTPALQMLNRLMEKVNGLAIAFEGLTEQIFGFSNGDNSTGVAATDMAAVAEAAADTESSLEESSKFLAGFDAMTKVSGNTAGANSNGTGTFEQASGNASLSSQSETKQLSLFEKQLNRIVNAAKKVGNFVKNRFAKPVKDAFGKLIAPAKRFADVCGKVFSDIQILGQPLLDWFTGPFCDSVESAISFLSTVAAGLLDSFTTIFDDIWNTAIFPLLQKLINDLLPIASNAFSGLMDIVSTLYENVKKAFDAVWMQVINPIMALIVGIILEAIDTVIGAWNTYGQPLIEAVKEAISNTGELVNTFWETTCKPVVDNIISTVKKLWDNHIKPFWDKFVSGLSQIALSILGFYNNTLKPVIDSIVKKIGPKIAKFVSEIAKWIGDLAGDIFDALGGIVDFIVGVFTGDWDKAWNGLKDTVGAVFKAMVDLVRTPVNAIIGIINGMISGVCSGINAVINALNALKIDVPDWVTKMTGVTSFGFAIPSVQAPQIPLIPALANGGYVKANTPQLAMIGDNRHHGEIVSPEDKLLDMAYQVASMAGGDSSLLKQIIALLEQLISIVQDGSDIVLIVDGEELARANAKGTMSLKRRYTTTDVEFA